MDGKLVNQTDLKGKDNSMRTDFLPSGIYLIELVVSGEKFYQKIIKY